MVNKCIRCGKDFESKYANKKTCSPECCYKRKGEIEDRFFAKVEKLETGCWKWTGSINERGYAEFWGPRKKNVRAHIWAYQHFVGPINDAEVVRHKCDKSWCVNPEHLITGSAADNSRDSFARNRRPHLKLTEQMVRDLRKALGEGRVEWKQYEAMGKLIGVNAHVIWMAHVKRTWKWVA